MISFAMTRLFTVLSLPGPDLLLRFYGERAFPILEDALVTVPLGRALTLDFRGISVMDTSFADETALELMLKLMDGAYGERFLALEEPSPATVDNLEGTIARRGVKAAFPVRIAEQMQVVGHLEPNLAEAWQLVHEAGTMTARDLADRLNLAINTASTRLHKLHKARLLARYEETTPVGRQHIYGVPT